MNRKSSSKQSKNSSLNRNRNFQLTWTVDPYGLIQGSDYELYKLEVGSFSGCPHPDKMAAMAPIHISHGSDWLMYQYLK